MFAKAANIFGKRTGSARSALLLNERAAANAFNRGAFDLIGNVPPEARVCGVEMHGELAVGRVVFFDTEAADFGLLEQLHRIGAR